MTKSRFAVYLTGLTLLTSLVEATTYTVANGTDAAFGPINNLSLRAAINRANGDTSTPHTIQIDNTVPLITLTSSLPPILRETTITSGTTTTIDAATTGRVFFIESNLPFALGDGVNPIIIQNAQATGGTGGGGAGGGMGAGAAIFAKSGSSLIIDTVTFSTCASTGGQGGAALAGVGQSGGGGGGIGGHGGASGGDSGGGGGGGLGGSGAIGGNGGGGGGGGAGGAGGQGGSSQGIDIGGGGGGGGGGDVGAGGTGADTSGIRGGGGGGGGGRFPTGVGSASGGSSVDGTAADTGSGGGGGGGPTGNGSPSLSSGAGGDGSGNTGSGGAPGVAGSNGTIGTGQAGGGGGGATTGLNGGNGGDGATNISVLVGGGGGGGGSGVLEGGVGRNGGSGGNGGYASGGGGGGGSGNEVSSAPGNGGNGFIDASERGGGGGGGGSAGINGTNQPGGNGGAGGINGGGGGGGAAGTAQTGSGGAGGWGGGGGGAGSSTNGGPTGVGGLGGFGGGAGSLATTNQDVNGIQGGFGGGGSGGLGTGSGGASIFGGGSGGDNPGAINIGGGGGGAALGGAIFLEDGATVELINPTFSGNTVTAGLGSGGGTNGQAQGLDIFMQTGSGLTITVPSGTLTLSNPIRSDALSSTGSFTKDGAGILILPALNNFRAVTYLNGGTLQGPVNAFPTDVQTADGTTVHFDEPAFPIVGVAISGPGQLIVSGAGRVTFGALVPQQLYGGDTTITSTQGVFIVNDDALPTGTFMHLNGGGGFHLFPFGSVTPHSQTVGSLDGTADVSFVTGSTFTVDANQNSSFAGALAGSGQGTFVKAGPATFTLTGLLSDVATTDVNGGLLLVNGHLTASNVNVLLGGTLGGTGTVFGTINNSGRVAPGNSIGTFSVTGDYNITNGVHENEIAPGSANTDLMIITNNLNLNGGSTLLVIPAMGTYPASTTYTIMTVGGTRTGTFSSELVQIGGNTFPLSGAGSFRGTVIYNPQDVQLVWEMLGIVPVLVNNGIGGNPLSVADALQTINPDPSTDLGMIYLGLNFLSPDQLAAALNQIQPSLFKAVSLAQQNTGTRITNLYTNRLHQMTNRSCVPQDDKWNIWFSGLGDIAHQHAQQQNLGYHEWLAGCAFGADYTALDHFIFGISSAYTSTDVKWEHHQAKSHTQGVWLGTYGGYESKHFFAHAALLGAYNKMHGSRQIRIPQLDLHRRAVHNNNGWEGIGFFETGATFGPSYFEVQPFGSIEYIHLWDNSFKEHGASGLNLHVESNGMDLWRGEAGVRFSSCFSIKSSKWIPEGKVSWIREVRRNGSRYTTEFAGTDVPFEVVGLHPNRSMLGVGLGVTGAFNDDRFMPSAYYNAEISDKYFENNFILTLRFAF